MTNEGSYVALGLKMWKTQLDRADKLFGGLPSEEVLREIAPAETGCLFVGSSYGDHTTQCCRY